MGIPVVDGHQGSAGPHQLGEQSRGYGSNDKLVALLDWVLHCSLCAGKNTGGRRKHVEDGTRRPRQGPHIIRTMHRGLATRAHLDPVGSWMLPVAGRVAAKNGSWFFSSSGLNCQSHSSALLRKPPGHGRTVLLHSAAGGHRRAEALTAGGLAMTATPSDSQEILLLVFLRTSESQNAWRCFAQTIFIVVIIICLSCSSARCRSEICNSAEDAGRRQAVQPRRSKKARGRGTHTRRTGMWTHCGSSRARGSLKGCKAVGPRLRRMWESSAWS